MAVVASADNAYKTAPAYTKEEVPVTYVSLVA